MPESDPRLRAALANAQRATDDAVAELRSMASSLRKEHEAYAKERDKRLAERAKQAREGELGPEAQRLQQRVDLRQTTWEDVLEGRDEHPSAVRARHHLRDNLRRVGEQVRQDPDFVEEDLEARRAEQRIQDELGR